MSRRHRDRWRQSTSRESAHQPMYTEHDFITLSKSDESEVIKTLASELKIFQNSLEKSNICKTRFELVVNLLLKVSSALSVENDMRLKAITIIGEVLSERCPFFHSALKLHVGMSAVLKKPQILEDNLNSVCDLFKVLLNTLPDSSWGVLPVDEMSATIKDISSEGFLKNGDSLLAKLKDLIEIRDGMKDQFRIKLVESSCAISKSAKKWDNSEYRTIPILPQWEEINTPKPPYKLRPNIVCGRYDDWDHYYDVQFRLLREDFISPLRKGISDYFEGKVGRDLRNVKVYQQVQIIRPLFTKAGLCHEIRFDTSRLKGFRWEHSKRLIFGSLLCLSPDNFHSKVFFATVSNREPRRLSRGFLEVMFQGGAELIAHKRLETKFVMVESLAYFEASRHILRSLQTAEVHMPFTNYLISNDCAVVSPPQYLRVDGIHPSTYNIQLIVKPMKGEGRFTSVAVADDSQWPTLDMTELDESQLNAIKMALRQETAVIQGPPGTGKTYIGLKIVQALLKNRTVWNSRRRDFDMDLPVVRNIHSPILVMCFTNHALDQFLEGILELHQFEKLRLIRIGGRSKNERIQECSLYNVKHKLRNVPKQAYMEMKRLFQAAEVCGRKCNERMMKYEDPKYDFIRLSDIMPVMDEHYYRSLLDPAETEEEQTKALDIWLGLCVKEVIEEYLPIEEDDSMSEDSASSEGSSYDGEQSEEEEDPEDEEENGERTIDIVGEANLEEEARLIDGISEMYKELNFEDRTDEVKPKKKEKIFNIRRTIKITQCKHIEQFLGWGMHQEAMKTYEVEEINNINDLNLTRRWKLYKFWHSKYRRFLLTKLEEDCRDYNTKCEDANRVQRDNDRYALQTADVIGMTTTGAAKYQHVLHIVKPKIVIVEEAAEVLESHIVSALNPGTHHLILIGDHKQLRPKPNEYDLAVKYKLDISLFERLVNNNFPHATLQIQHRMRPAISELVRGHIYDTLEDHESVKNYPKVKGISENLFLIQHCQPEKGNENLSHSNDHEASYLVALCRYLLQQAYKPNQITILTTYTGQLLTLKNLMPIKDFEGVQVKTVDNFQGEENDIILLSLVRSNKHGNIGFLKEENRVCVALSRAKHGFYCIGNFEMLRAQADIWEKIVSDMKTKGKVGEALRIHCNNHPRYRFEAVSPGDFAKHSPNGGCNLDCEYRLNCGHQCRLKCHNTDPEHLEYKCKKTCNRECPEGHMCTKLCFQECYCDVRITRILPYCGHNQEMYCRQDPEDVPCSSKCSRQCSEGHNCTLLCGEVCCCYTKVLKTIPKCGHSQEMYCHQDPKYISCTHNCSRQCSEGHNCTLLCSKVCRCYTKVLKTIPKCGHSQEMYCHQDPKYISCTHNCSRQCSEGHNCTLLCSEVCCCYTKVLKTIPKCGHSQEMYCYEIPAEVNCNKSCEKKCPTGHPCLLMCYEQCPPCKVRESMTFPNCGHQAVKYCSQDLSEVKCKSKCEKKCKNGHPCQKKCFQDCSICTVPLETTLKCGHKATLMCSEDPSKHICNEPCYKKLKCGHKCLSQCGIESSGLTCLENVQITLKCGHKCLSQCGIESSDLTCLENVQITLKCGHSANIECKDYNFFYRCIQPCQKLLKCGHKCTRLCGEDCNQTVCQVMVEKICSQGHKLFRPCYQQRLDHHCTAKCRRKLSCGHACQKICSDTCEKVCNFLVKKTYPCGHQHMIPCSFPIEDKPCDVICRFPLACGHLCRGKCSDCRSTRIHKPCESSVKLKHFCGEEVRMKCSGLKYIHNEPSTRVLLCKHKKIPYDCQSNVLECHEPCEWRCIHHQCSNLCHEQCDRPPCNERCNLFLDCGHQCVGLCGEPCITICPECDKEAFLKQLEFSKDLLYTQLPCGHIFSISEMDKYADSHPRSKITPLQCPECSSPLSCSYRYGNIMKKSLTCVDTVKRKIMDLSRELEEQSDAEKSRIVTIFQSTLNNLLSKLKDNHACFSSSIKCLRHISRVIFKPSYIVKAEERLLIFSFIKVLQFALLDVKYTDIFKPMLHWLIKEIIKKEKVQFSFQIIHDIKSELYRLCIYAKSLIYRQSYEYAAKITFLEQCTDNPNMRVSKKDFVFHSKLLDKKCKARGIILSLDSTEDLIRDIEYFQPLILNGSWKKCRQDHYYCIPVSESKALSVQCPECTGDSTGNIGINVRIVQEVNDIDIAQQREAVLTKIEEEKKIYSAQGESSPHTKKKSKRKKRRKRH